MSATSEVEQTLAGLRRGDLEFDLAAVAADLPDLLEVFLCLERPDLPHRFLARTVIEVSDD